ncbi:Nucleotidyltransferase [Amylocystis lapponica]|nr:Nucleotidyltransferase [Amylocystis lapponica]
MPFKRPPLRQTSPSQSESSSSRLPLVKRSKHSPKSLPDVNIYIVQAKLNPSEISELFGLAERHAARLCSDPEHAEVVVTAVGMRRRLERHLPWELAKQKAVVTPQWLRDSVKHGAPLPCGDYAALQDLHDETVTHCPDCNATPCACSESSYPSSSPSRPPTSRSNSSRTPSPHKTHVVSTSSHDTVSSFKPSTFTSMSVPTPVHIPVNLLPPPTPIPTNIAKLSPTSRYACQRASPLVCPNEALVAELDVMRRARTLEGEARSALSYQRAVAAVKACPHRITSMKQVEKLPFVGDKISHMIEQFLNTGHMTEAQTLRASERFRTLSLFASIYGIGPTTARRLYALGLRSLADLEVYYGANSRTGQPDGREVIEIEQSSRRAGGHGEHGGIHGLREKDEGDEGLGESWIRIALELREDLSVKIPRPEVEEMGRVVMAELHEIEPGCVNTIVGGYRRGKPESNDVDIVFTHPDPTRVRGLCKRLVRRLHERGMVTHVMHLSGFHSHNPLRTTHWDSLEKALTVFILPPSSPFSSGTRRRLDLIFAPPEVYWTAVVGWSGSIMFQRDLRQLAKDKHAMKFDSSGITRRYDSKQFFPKTEKEVFDLFGLEWVDPTLRNADA